MYRVLQGSCSMKFRAGGLGGEAPQEAGGFGGPPGPPIVREFCLTIVHYSLLFTTIYQYLPLLTIIEHYYTLSTTTRQYQPLFISSKV